MKSPALYLLEVFFCSGMLLAFYRLLLVRKVSFAACRRYLVAAMLLSAAICCGTHAAVRKFCPMDLEKRKPWRCKSAVMSR